MSVRMKLVVAAMALCSMAAASARGESESNPDAGRASTARCASKTWPGAAIDEGEVGEVELRRA